MYMNNFTRGKDHAVPCFNFKTCNINPSYAMDEINE